MLTCQSTNEDLIVYMIKVDHHYIKVNIDLDKYDKVYSRKIKVNAIEKLTMNINIKHTMRIKCHFFINVNCK